MEYRVDDRSLSGETFLDFVQQGLAGSVQSGADPRRTVKNDELHCLDGGQLAGCLRVLTDGCFFGIHTELAVLPAYQRQASEAGCCGWLLPIPPRCCISAPSRGGSVL